MDIIKAIAALINEDENSVGEFFAAVACVEGNKGQWLLGLSTASDDRKGTWCFVGGGIKSGETPEKAAVRECREESGVTCKSVGKAIKRQDKPGVAFVHCRTVGTPKVKPNHEFSAMGFFSVKEMKSLKLYPNVKDLIKRL